MVLAVLQRLLSRCLMHGMVAKNATMTRHERAVAAITVSSTYSSVYVLSV
jgi:hypothetical protein